MTGLNIESRVPTVGRTQHNKDEVPDFGRVVFQRVEAIQSSLQIDPQNLTKDIQIELSMLLNILRRIDRFSSSRKITNNRHLQSDLIVLLNTVAVAVSALKHEQNLPLIKSIRMDTMSTIRRLESPFLGSIYTVFEKFANRSSTAVKVLVGLTLAIPLYFTIPASMIVLLNEASNSLQANHLISDSEEARSTEVPEIFVQDFREGTALMILSFIAGATGSIISILSRVSEYNKPAYEEKYGTSFLPIFIGLFKPVIGGTFGVLVFAIMNTSLLDSFLDQPRTDSKWFTVISVTFVVGFSERLAKDMIGKVEGQLGSTSNPMPSDSKDT
ncbi:MAG: hypothetical protein AAGA40_05350 [Cyanobacteria bacterium P01_E01_bin.45]